MESTSKKSSARAAKRAKSNAAVSVTLTATPSSEREDDAGVVVDSTAVIALGEPLVLSAAAAEPHAASDVDESDVPSDSGESLKVEVPQPQPHVSAEPVPYDEDSPLDHALPYDEDGPYDEVANPESLTFDASVEYRIAQAENPSALEERLRDLPAPNPQSIATSAETSSAVGSLEGTGGLDIVDGVDSAAAVVDAPPAEDEDEVVDEGEIVDESEVVDADSSRAHLASTGHGIREAPRSGDDTQLLITGDDWKAQADARDLGTSRVSGSGVDDDGGHDVENITVNDAEVVADNEVLAAPEPEPAPAPEAALEPEPLVEPSPLPRSPFEPDLSKVGRTDTVAASPDRMRVKPVRPRGDEPIFTTADRLRASAFAPVASERVSDQPAPAVATGAPESDTGESEGTPSEPSSAQSSQPRESPSTGDADVSANDISASGSGRPITSPASSVSEAANASEDAVCAQCGASLVESDIFCGVCGFVKHGVGPGPRSVVPPALDPFPWGTPTVRPDTAASSTQALLVEPEEPAELAVPIEQEEPVELPGSHEHEGPTERALVEDDPDSPQVSQPDTSSDSGMNSEIDPANKMPLNYSGDDRVAVAENAGVDRSQDSVRTEPEPEPKPEAQPEPQPAAEASGDANSGPSSASSTPNDDDPEFEQVSVAPVRSIDNAPSAVDGERSASDDKGGVTPGLSVLAPPPMSHHRVELPIAPPMPLASGATDIEDIEDTRIVDRSQSGTRFVLQFSTGDSVIVTGTGLVGRNPIQEPSEKFDILVPITDPSKSVSKTHLEFGQMAGAFWISDRYSGNGTVVREPAGEPKRCEPGKRYRVMRGTRVEIGEQFFIVS
ncbi:hypothetical protein A20C1_00931 [marine actinobacterium PHSC20C1]|nr:hypothetical protein A20C1_00931 [marine actinobacterium PHSC20C1]